MKIDIKIKKAVEVINAQLEELFKIVNRAEKDSDIHSARERLKRWKSRTISLLSKHINPYEAEELKKKRKSSFIMGQPIRNLSDEAKMYHGFLLTLKEEIGEHPEDILSIPIEKEDKILPVKVPKPATSRTVFIVHGRDDLNKLRLEKLLHKRWRLEPIILSEEAGKGRTLIEKFEQEAQRATYAMAIFTPDDLIKVEGKKYTQARPNAIFELGWFYGRLGRKRVCILFKKGTKIHSDLEGIIRIEFGNSIEEKIMEIEKELKEAGLL